MLPKEIIHKIRQIEIHTRRLLSGSMIGDSRSALKGTGLEFDQIREYQMGDDVRFIDWNSSARMNKLLVKQYIEERNRTILLAVDASASQHFSSVTALKRDVVAEVASVLTLVADYGKDHISLILFSDDIEKNIPAGRGRNHVAAIMESLFSYKPHVSKTNITKALEHVAKEKRKDGILFLISDFIDTGFERALSIANRMYDVVAIRCLDGNETQLPDIGFITVEDAETGEVCALDTRKKGGVGLNTFLERRIEEQNMLFKKYAVDYIDVRSDRPFIGELIRFFRRRMRY